jgi:diguanylate cyclase (GGDEF)-like protein
MRRRFTYALTAGVLSSGAPAGLLGVRLAKSPGERVSLSQVRRELTADRTAYLYIGGATALIFAAFGYFLGRQADRLAQLSETDSLTELLNARGFAHRLHVEVKRSKRYRQPLSLLFLDLDGLKNINDRHGHRAGSDALKQVAHVVRWEMRESDTGARWGGDEFTILAPNTSTTAALAFAERIRSRIAEQRMGWRMTASIGIATLTGNETVIAEDAVTLLRRADTAMYQAKRSGKNTVVAASTVQVNFTDPTKKCHLTAVE